MRQWRLRHYWIPLLAATLIFGAVDTSSLFALTSSSPNYQVIETDFNAGANFQSCSGQYCAQVSIGDPTDGTSTGTSTASFSEAEDTEPVLEVIVDTGSSNLGVLSTEQTATKTMTVRVRNYLSGGYVLQIIGDPPKFEGYSLKTSREPTPMNAGTEQFGINVTANTRPDIGALPVQIPSNQTVFGVVAEGYDIPDMFKYTSGDVVARSNQESGRTDYTVSMVVNISSSTPPGKYSSDFAAVVIPAY